MVIVIIFEFAVAVVRHCATLLNPHWTTFPSASVLLLYVGSFPPTTIPFTVQLYTGALPPLTAVAEKLTGTPEQTSTEEDVMPIPGVSTGWTVIATALDEAVAGVAQSIALFIRQVTISLSFKMLLLNAGVFPPTFAPFTCHS